MKRKFFKTALGTSILATIVGCDAEVNSEKIDSGELYHENNFEGKKAVSISLGLSVDDKSYLLAIKKLGDDILSYPELAESFSKAPQTYFQKYGYNGEVRMDDGLLKMILAYADEDIRTAINNNDLKSFVRYCKEKGVFDGAVSKVNIPEKLIVSLEGGGEVASSDIQPYSWFWFAEWVALGVAYAISGMAFESYTISHNLHEGVVASVPVRSSNNNMYLLWELKSRSNKSTSYAKFMSEYYKNCISDVVDLLKDLRPDLFEQRSEEDVYALVTKSLDGELI